MHTGDALAGELKAHGLGHVFGVPGEQTMALYDALDGDKSVRHIVMRDERNLPYAGAAYSRVSGEVEEINRVSNPADVLVGDASWASGWAAVYYRIREAGRRVVLPRGMAGLGFGLPAAVGAKAAVEENVFLLAGDGSFAYSLGELITLKEYGLKVISVVLNNRSRGWMELAAKATFGKELFGLPDVRFAKVAEAMGLNGIRVTDPEDLGPALRDAVDSPESSVIEVESAVWEAPVLSLRDVVEGRKSELAMATP